MKSSVSLWIILCFHYQAANFSNFSLVVFPRNFTCPINIAISKDWINYEFEIYLIEPYNYYVYYYRIVLILRSTYHLSKMELTAREKSFVGAVNKKWTPLEKIKHLYSAEIFQRRPDSFLISFMASHNITPGPTTTARQTPKFRAAKHKIRHDYAWVEWSSILATLCQARRRRSVLFITLSR